MASGGVLIVGGDGVNADRLKGMLEELGYGVAAVLARAEALEEALAEHRPDLILMTLNVAGDVSLAATAEQIRASHDIPVVYLSSRFEKCSEEECSSPYWYLVEPVEEGLLGKVIEVALGRRRMEQRNREIEAQLRQAHKLEAIGTLAGGIAHDFNNILAPIIGYTEMALGDIPEASPTRQDLEQVLVAARRARDLVKQIVAFSRFSHEQQRVPVNIDTVVQNALKLLRATIPSSIEIKADIHKGMALADATQIHQLVLNLCTNAAHAIGERGVIEVKLTRLDLKENERLPHSLSGLRPGPYLELSISDTGHGMDAATLERIFDPYFTTKEVGKGSGLGLAIVRGIVKRHEGAVWVRSEPGKGSIFHVCIPAVESCRPEWGTSQTSGRLPRGGERILLVDDESMVVDLGSRILAQLGYKVESRLKALEALHLFRSSPHAFGLVITDYTMPDMTGTELASEILRIRPDIPIILCTGFSEKVTEKTAREAGIAEFVMKPLDRHHLARLVRSVLDSKKS